MKKFLTSIIVVVLLLSVVCGCVACNKKAPLEQVVDCVIKLKEILNDETFEISNDCGYQKYYQDEDGIKLNIYIAIQFKVTNASGEDVYDIAYFVNGSYVGLDSNYEDGTYDTWSDSKKLQFLESALICIDGYYTEVFSKDEVNSALDAATAAE